MATKSCGVEEIYNREYRRLRTLTSQSDIIAVSVSLNKFYFNKLLLIAIARHPVWKWCLCWPLIGTLNIDRKRSTIHQIISTSTIYSQFVVMCKLIHSVDNKWSKVEYLWSILSIFAQCSTFIFKICASFPYLWADIVISYFVFRDIVFNVRIEMIIFTLYLSWSVYSEIKIGFKARAIADS